MNVFSNFAKFMNRNPESFANSLPRENFYQQSVWDCKKWNGEQCVVWYFQNQAMYLTMKNYGKNSKNEKKKLFGEPQVITANILCSYKKNKRNK